jgi:hypothetical protein
MISAVDSDVKRLQTILDNITEDTVGLTNEQVLTITQLGLNLTLEEVESVRA